MWSLSSGASPRLRRLLVLTARGRAALCNFSTAPIRRASIGNRSKMEEDALKYDRWTKDALIKRIHALEQEVRTKNGPATAAVVSAGTAESSLKGKKEGAVATETKTGPGMATESEPQKKKKKKAGREIDPSKYSTRLIALKLAYLGKNYGGFEYQPSAKVPTIEEELWKAMVKGCLIFPENPDEVNFDPWEYSKCGRTDRGVSAFGQVIGIRVRSNRPLPKKPEEQKPTETSDDKVVGEVVETPEEAAKAPEREFDDFADELPYARLLNRLLPPDIRILAWCPTTPADFSARHHCRERQYRYFFTQPAYSPTPGATADAKGQGKMPKDGWLDIEAMRAAAKKYEGLHDFRNFCRIDGSKPQQSFERRIFESDIVEVPGAETALAHLRDPAYRPPPPSPSSAIPSEPSTTASPPPPLPREEDEGFPKVYYFHVRGSAFIWHQIRCMVAVLFAVGQGLEDPSVVDRLLDVAAEPRRPAYVLANETPLVLWDCLFPRDLDADPTAARRPDDMAWAYVGDDVAAYAHGPTGLVDHLWAHWRERKMDELLAGQLLGVVVARSRSARWDDARPLATRKVFEGGNRERAAGRYVPLLEKERLASPQEAYDKEARRKGFRDSAHMQEVIAQRKAEAEAEAEAGVASGEAVV